MSHGVRKRARVRTTHVTIVYEPVRSRAELVAAIPSVMSPTTKEVEVRQEAQLLFLGN